MSTTQEVDAFVAFLYGAFIEKEDRLLDDVPTSITRTGMHHQPEAVCSSC